MEPLESQRELLEIVIELQRLDHRLHRLTTDLPRPQQQDHMFEGRIPSDVATELYSTITYGQVEQLRPLIASLAAGTQVTNEALRQRFRRRQEGLDEERACLPFGIADLRGSEAMSEGN